MADSPQPAGTPAKTLNQRQSEPAVADRRLVVRQSAGGTGGHPIESISAIMVAADQLNNILSTRNENRAPGMARALNPRNRKVVVIMASVLFLQMMMMYFKLLLGLCKLSNDSCSSSSSSSEEEDAEASDSDSEVSNQSVTSRPAKKPRLVQVEDDSISDVSCDSRGVEAEDVVAATRSQLSEVRAILEMTVEKAKKWAGLDEESVNMRKNVIDDLGKLPGLTRHQVIDAAAALSRPDANSILKLFYSLKNDESRLLMVKRLLRLKGLGVL